MTTKQQRKNDNYVNFVHHHQRILEASLEKGFGKNSLYYEALSKAGHPNVLGFKGKFTKYIYRKNQYRAEDPKMFDGHAKESN